MSWFARSLTGLLDANEGEGEQEKQGTELTGAADEPFSPKSVKEDLSELGRQLWGGVASFLAPPAAPKRQEVEDDDTELVDTQALEESEHGAGSVSSPKLAGLHSDIEELKGGFVKGLSRLSSVIRVVAADGTSEVDSRQAEEQDVKQEKQALSLKIISGIDEISKLASTIFPFVQEDDSEELWEAPGITDEVVTFARDISTHPETWLDFPLTLEVGAFDMNDAQKAHARAVQQAASRLAALKRELCPEHMSEARFWKIYFVLLHSRLSAADCTLLSTSQVLEARKLLLAQLQDREAASKGGDDSNADSAVGDNDTTVVVDKDAIESTVKLAASPSSAPTAVDAPCREEQDADEWLQSEEATGTIVDSSSSSRGPRRQQQQHQQQVHEEDDISFSDLEDEESKVSTSSENRWVQLESSDEPKKQHQRASSSDWLTVEQEDVHASS